MPVTRPVLEDQDGLTDPSTCSQKRSAVAPLAAMSSMASVSMWRSSAAVWLSGARLNGMKRTLPTFQPSKKRGVAGAAPAGPAVSFVLSSRRWAAVKAQAASTSSRAWRG